MGMSIAEILAMRWLKVSALLILFIVAYWIPIKAMVDIWWTNEDYSYGFLIPAVSSYLLWEKRKILNEIPVKSSWIALPALIVFILFSVYGILGSSGSASISSIPILLILFIAFCFGIEAVKRLILPLCFLVFMVPVPDFVDRYVSFYLKAISSKLGGAIIGLFDISVYVSGNIIDLGVTQLQVVDACSGLRYLFPLVALGVLYAYFFERVLWKRVVCVAATLPISVLMNGLRIGLTGILASSFGPTVAESFFHGLSGLVLFFAAFIMLSILGRILRKFPPKVPPTIREASGETRGTLSFPKPRTDISSAFYTSAMILMVVATLTWSTGVMPPVKIRGGIESFPLTIGAWRGQHEMIDPMIIEKSGAEEAFSALYRKPDIGTVSLYMGYRSSAFLSNENFFHSPTVCLPASGWNTIEEAPHIITNVPFFGTIKVTKMVSDYMGQKKLVYFWFQTKGKATHDKNENRFHLALHAIKRDNTHDLFIRPIISFQPGESIEDAENHMDLFVRDMMTVLLRFLKENQYEESK